MSLVNAVGSELGLPDLIPQASDIGTASQKVQAAKLTGSNFKEAPISKTEQTRVALDTAQKSLGVPKIMWPRQMSSPGLDEFSVMTYIAMLRNHATVHGKRFSTSGDSSETQGQKALSLAPPAVRRPDWRTYSGVSLGGRRKIVVYYRHKSSDVFEESNVKAFASLLKAKGVTTREDFEPFVAIDLGMSVGLQNSIFAKAGSDITPVLFIDDEYTG